MRLVSSALAGLVILGLVSGCKTYVDSMGGDDAAVDDDGAGDDDTGGDDDAADDDSDGVDADGDGHTEAQGDCDDGDPTTYPGAPDLCDGIVNDCDAVLMPHSEDGIVDFVAADGTVTVLTELFAGTGIGTVVDHRLVAGTCGNRTRRGGHDEPVAIRACQPRSGASRPSSSGSALLVAAPMRYATSLDPPLLG